MNVFNNAPPVRKWDDLASCYLQTSKLTHCIMTLEAERMQSPNNLMQILFNRNQKSNEFFLRLIFLDYDTQHLSLISGVSWWKNYAKDYAGRNTTHSIEQMSKFRSVHRYVFYAPDGLFWLNLYLFYHKQFEPQCSQPPKFSLNDFFVVLLALQYM